MPKQNTPGQRAEGVVCLLPASVDTDSLTTAALRSQFLTARFGLPTMRAAILSPLAFGEEVRRYV